MGRRSLKTRDLQHSIGNVVLVFDLDLVLDLDGFFDRASLDS
jgi:hypothetical protein